MYYAYIADENRAAPGLPQAPFLLIKNLVPNLISDVLLALCLTVLVEICNSSLGLGFYDYVGQC